MAELSPSGGAVPGFDGWPLVVVPAPWWAVPAGRDEPPPFEQSLGWLGPESIDWRVLDQTDMWVDARFRPHRLEDMPTDYLLNVVGFIADNMHVLDRSAEVASFCLRVRRPVVDSPLWQRIHALLTDRVRPAP